MRTYAYILIIAFAVLEVFVHANIFKSRDERDSPLQRSVVLHILDLLGKLAGLGGVAMLPFTCDLWICGLVAVVSVVYAVKVRQYFLQREFRRLKKRLPKEKDEELLERVQRRASLHYVM